MQISPTDPAPVHVNRDLVISWFRRLGNIFNADVVGGVEARCFHGVPRIPLRSVLISTSVGKQTLFVDDVDDIVLQALQSTSNAGRVRNKFSKRSRGVYSFHKYRTCMSGAEWSACGASSKLDSELKFCFEVQLQPA